MTTADRAATFARVLRLDPARTALLVVDMQRGFVEPGEAMEVPQARDAIAAIQRLLSSFRAAHRPVVFTEFTYSPAAPVLVGELHPEHKPASPRTRPGAGVPSSCCLEGDASTRTIEALAPRPDELVVRKRWYDGFAGTELDGALRAQNVNGLVITGTMTDICVLATVVGAFNREYRIAVVEDAVATLWADIQRATLDIVGRAFARVVSSKTILEELDHA